MNEFRKNLLKTSLTLMIIAGGASLLVGATNAITAPVIEQNSIEKERKQLSKVYDTADAFIEWKVYSSDEKTKYKSEDENGQYLSTLSLNYVQKVWTAERRNPARPLLSAMKMTKLAISLESMERMAMVRWIS